jgi:arylsulfatase A-like enzyme
VAKKYGYTTAVVSSQNETWGSMDQFLESRNLDLLFDSRSSDATTYVAKSDTPFAYYSSEGGFAGKLDDRVTVSRAIDWIKDCSDRKQAYVLCMNLQTSHFPYQLPLGADCPFEPCQMDFIASFVQYPKDKVPVVKNAYYNALHYIDGHLGRLVAFLDQQRLRERTLIVLVGDNGECFYENGHCTHAGPPFEPAIHVPLILNCPGMLAPREEDYLTQGIDAVPTTLRLMGLPLSPCFQGTDVLAEDRLPADRRLAFIHNCTLVRASADAVISATGWKYVFNRSTQNGALYNLRADSGEQTPVQATFPEVAEALDRILQRWREVQLAYYGRPEYYGIYYPPPTPRLSDADYAILKRDR